MKKLTLFNVWENFYLLQQRLRHTDDLAQLNLLFWKNDIKGMVIKIIEILLAHSEVFDYTLEELERITLTIQTKRELIYKLLTFNVKINVGLSVTID